MASYFPGTIFRYTDKSDNKYSCKVNENGQIKEMIYSNKRGNKIFESLDSWMKYISEDLSLKHITVEKCKNFNLYYEFLYKGNNRNGLGVLSNISREVSQLHPFLCCDLNFIGYLEKVRDIINKYYYILKCEYFHYRNNYSELYNFKDDVNTMGYEYVSIESFTSYKSKKFADINDLNEEQIYKLYRRDIDEARKEFIPAIRDLLEYIGPSMRQLSLKNNEHQQRFYDSSHIKNMISKLNRKIYDYKYSVELLEKKIIKLRNILKSTSEKYNEMSEISDSDSDSENNSVTRNDIKNKIENRIENLESQIIINLRIIRNDIKELEKQRELLKELENKGTILKVNEIFYSI